MRNTRAYICCVVVLLSATVAPARGDEASAKAKLAKMGIRALTSGVTLAEEIDFSKAVSSASSLKAKLQETMSAQQQAQYNYEEVGADIQELLQENELLKKQQSQASKNFVYRRNRLLRWQFAQTMQNNTNEIALLTETQKQVTKEAQRLRESADTAREEFVQRILDARTLADRLVRQYADLTQDQEVAAALKEWNEAAGYSYSLKPSHKFEASLKRLKYLEHGILSDKVPLRRDGKNYYVTVTINGKQTCEMLVDTAAPAIVLPFEIAVAAGVNLDGAAQTAVGQRAVGRNAQKARVLLDSVSVGKLTADHVGCIVLPEKDKAKPVLGMTFLSRFKFEFDAKASQLSLLRVDAELPVVKRKKSAKHRQTSSKSAQHALSDAP